MIKVIASNLTILLKVLVVFFAPIKGIIILVALSTILDTAFGVWKASKLKEKVNSKTFRHGFVPKLFSYVGAIMLVYASDFFIINYLTKEVISVDYLATKVIALMLISIEVKSMDESFEKVKGYSFITKIVKLIIQAKNVKKKITE
jgi:peptidoglycan biosynthesis protein MviN/MurJ (putative lipid II flippase)